MTSSIPTLSLRSKAQFVKVSRAKTEKQKNTYPKGTLAFVAWVFARLGGWTGYYGKPGPIVMLRA